MRLACGNSYCHLSNFRKQNSHSFCYEYCDMGNTRFNTICRLYFKLFRLFASCYAIMLIVRKIKSKTSGFVIDKILKKYISKSQNLENYKSNFSKYFTLAAFVSVPLPLTGVWSGSLIAGLSNLNINYCFIAITIGSLISAATITILCTIFENSIAYIFMISLVIIIAFMFVDLFISLIKSKAKKKKNS